MQRVCDFLLCQEGKKIRAVATSYTADIAKEANCKTQNLVYCIDYKNATKKQYIGKTDMNLEERFSEHRGYVSRKI